MKTSVKAMLYESGKLTDVEQPQIEMEIVGKTQRTTGQGDSISVYEIEIFGRTYHRAVNYENVMWEDEDSERLDHGNPELEIALECAYREKYFDTEETTDGTK